MSRDPREAMRRALERDDQSRAGLKLGEEPSVPGGIVVPSGAPGTVVLATPDDVRAIADGRLKQNSPSKDRPWLEPVLRRGKP